jgi:DNA-binding NtrC family response regulator
MLMQYPWPGNVRQLQNAVECAVVMNGSAVEIEPYSLPSEIREPAAIPADVPAASIGVPMPATPPEGINFANAMSQIERDLILTYLKRAGGNKRQAARMLSLSRTTLIDKLHRLGVTESAIATGTHANLRRGVGQHDYLILLRSIGVN